MVKTSNHSSHNKLPGISSQNPLARIPSEEMMNKTSFTHKTSLAGPKNPREKHEAPRYKGLSEKRNMVNFKKKIDNKNVDTVYFKKRIEDKNMNMTFKPKINPRKDLAKSMNFYV
jgi:hypothetical protein